jgi:DNA invertase Pin-like site-specific DNA recombinase
MVARTFFTTKWSKKKTTPGLEEALKYARKGDTIIVWRLDRLGRKHARLDSNCKQLK